MLSLKPIHKLFAYVALLLALVSFSGFTSFTAQYHKPQTELVLGASEIDTRTIVYRHTAYNHVQKVKVNQYTVFNFACLLKAHNFNYKITFKSQKQAVFQFRDFNSILERNLIAHTQIDDSHNVFVE